MRKIFIVGISGTGKSILGRMLAETTGLPLYHMDSIIWCPDWVEAKEDSVCVALADIASRDRWIAEGWIDVYSKDILQRSDVILYLDYPGWLAACGGVQRWWAYKNKKRPEMPEGCFERFDFRFLLTMLLRKERHHIESVLSGMPQLNILRVRSRHELEKVVSELVDQYMGH